MAFCVRTGSLWSVLPGACHCVRASGGARSLRSRLVTTAAAGCRQLTGFGQLHNSPDAVSSTNTAAAAVTTAAATVTTADAAVVVSGVEGTERAAPGPCRRLRVALVGAPNSGKSTLTNALAEWQACAVSSRAHTTRTTSRLLLTVPLHTDHRQQQQLLAPPSPAAAAGEGEGGGGGYCQLVLSDTPGLVATSEVGRYRLDGRMLNQPRHQLRHHTDLVCVLHDVSQPWPGRGRLSAKVQRLLFETPALQRPVTAVLVLTKVDALRDRSELLELVERLTDGRVGNRDTPAVARYRAARQLAAEVHQAGLHELLPQIARQRKATADDDRLPPSLAQYQLPKRTVEWLESVGVEVAEGCVGADSEERWRERAEWRQLVLDGLHEQLSERQLQLLTRRWRSWPLFDHVFMTSARSGKGVDALRQYLCQSALRVTARGDGDAGGGGLVPCQLSPALAANQSPQQLALSMLHCRLLEFLPNSLPYRVRCHVDQWERSGSGVLAVQMALVFERVRDARYMLRHVRLVAQSTEQLLRDCFRCEVLLRLRIAPDPKTGH